MLRGAVLLFIVGVGLFAALWLERGREISLPKPTGPFAVGRSVYDWAAQGREVLVWIWYPAETGQAARPDDYYPAPTRAALETFRGPISRFLMHDLSKVQGHSIRDARLAPQEPSYPVAILRGGASLGVVSYSVLAEDLARHGYVVVGIDAPFRTQAVAFPDGRVATRLPENNVDLCSGSTPRDGCVNRLLTAWTADMAFVTDRLERLNAADPSGKFTGRLDMNRLGVFGHSFGGTQAAQFCHDDSRCKAGIDIDGLLFGSVVTEGLHQPFLFLLSDQIHSSDTEARQFRDEMQSIYDRLPANGRLRLVIRGANHYFFSEDGALLRSHIVLRALRGLGVVGIDGQRQLAITAYLVRSFFDAHLKGGSVSPLQAARSLYPEIEVLE